MNFKKESEPALKALIIDPSAVVRVALSDILSGAGILSMAVADPVFALDKMSRGFQPDVILTDLKMPRMDGLSFIKKMMADDPIPIVVCSCDGEGALQALREGAVAMVEKAGLGVKQALRDSAILIVDAVKGAARAEVTRRIPSRILEKKNSVDAMLLPGRKTAGTRTGRIVVIGASTGGTQALEEIISALPPDAPGIVVVQHMPEVFTAAFAARLNSLYKVEVKEAADGDAIMTGRVLIAPGNRHTVLERNGFVYSVRVIEGPLINRHRPSVDVLFRSAAQEAGANAIGVILTGMGDDGAEGLLEMRHVGASTIAQNEETCVVFGMPKEAIAVGAAEKISPIGSIAGDILKLARAQS